MTLSIGVQGSIRLLIIFLDEAPNLELYRLTLKLFEQGNQSGHKKILDKCLKLVMKVITIMGILYLICIFGPICYSVLVTVLHNKAAYAYPLAIPGLNSSSIIGYAINTSIQFYLSVIIWAGYVSNDSQSILYVVQVKVLIDMFKLKLDELSTCLGSSPDDIKARKKKIKEIYELHAEIKYFTGYLQKLLCKPCFVIVWFNTYLVCACGISLLTINDYYSCIGFLIQGLFLLFIFCAMGSFVDHQHGQMLNALWMFDWHKLQVAEQKDWLNFMVDAQRPFDLKPIFLGVMNFELFIKVRAKILLNVVANFSSPQIINGIYSYFMVMWNIIHK